MPQPLIRSAGWTPTLRVVSPGFDVVNSPHLGRGAESVRFTELLGIIPSTDLKRHFCSEPQHYRRVEEFA